MHRQPDSANGGADVHKLFYVRRDLQRPHWQWGSAPHGWWGRGSAAGDTVATELSQPKSKRGGIRSGPIGSRALRPMADGVVVAPRDNYLTHDRYRARPATDKDRGQRFKDQRPSYEALDLRFDDL